MSPASMYSFKRSTLRVVLQLSIWLEISNCGTADTNRKRSGDERDDYSAFTADPCKEDLGRCCAVVLSYVIEDRIQWATWHRRNWAAK